MNQSPDQYCIVDVIAPNKQAERSAAETLRAAYK